MRCRHCFFLICRPRSSSLFPYTTLFRSSLTISGPVVAQNSQSVGTPSNPDAELHQRILNQAISEYNRRSEEHTSELQSRGQLVCRLLLEKKKHTSNSLHILDLIRTMPTI